MSDPQNKETQTRATAKPKRRFRILLGVSLALNLLVVGAIVGAIANGPRDRNGPPSARTIAEPYVAAFDRSNKREMRKQMRARLGDRNVSISANKADYVEFSSIVRAAEFDADRASKVLEAQIARVGVVQQVGRAIAIERIETMTLEERIVYADRLDEQVAKIGKRKRLKER